MYLFGLVKTFLWGPHYSVSKYYRTINFFGILEENFVYKATFLFFSLLLFYNNMKIILNYLKLPTQIPLKTVSQTSS